MENEVYGIVGSWDWDGSTAPKGLHVCRFSQHTGLLEPVSGILPEVKTGFQPLPGREEILYIVDEQKHTKSRRVGGGGYLYAVRFRREDETLQVLCQRESLGVNPCGCALSKSGQYLLVVHHTSTKNTATRLVRQPDGTISNTVIQDDAALVMFRLSGDGIIQEPCDYAVQEPGPGRKSMLHSIYRAGDGNQFILCDKGLDCLYSYRLDEETGTLSQLDVLQVREHSRPRYCAFHPALPIFYGSNEGCEKLYTYTWNPESGKLNQVQEVPFFHGKGEKTVPDMSSDILVTPDGKYLYVALRGADQVIAFGIDEQGMAHPMGAEPCGGKNPRGLAIDPSGKFLYSCNTESDNIMCFGIQKDGSLVRQGMVSVSRPANLVFIGSKG